MREQAKKFIKKKLDAKHPILYKLRESQGMNLDEVTYFMVECTNKRKSPSFLKSLYLIFSYFIVMILLKVFFNKERV